MDVHVRLAITLALRRRGVDVVTAQEDAAAQLPDPELLDRATSRGRILFSRDADLLAVAAERQRKGLAFAGLVYAHQLRVTVGQCITDLELIAKASTREELANRIEYLPLR